MKNLFIFVILALFPILIWGQDAQDAVVYKINGQEISVVGEAQKYSQYFEEIVGDSIDILYIECRPIIRGFSLPFKEATAVEAKGVIYDRENKTISPFKEEMDPDERNGSLILSLFLLSVVFFMFSHTKKSQEKGTEKVYLMVAAVLLMLPLGFLLVMMLPTLELILFGSFFILTLFFLLIAIAIKAFLKSESSIKFFKIIKIFIAIFYSSAILTIIIL
ncbi:MAG TPA: hypothetical protein PK142_02770 [bacterium]|nr:hypothetical protein [bacterium]